MSNTENLLSLRKFSNMQLIAGLTGIEKQEPSMSHLKEGHKEDGKVT